MKTKTKFNIIDTFVILLILALIFGIVFFTLRESGTIYAERNEKKITYTVRISNVKEEYIKAFTLGSKTLNSATLNYLGTVSGVLTEKMTSYSDVAVPGASEGEYVLKQNVSENTYDIYITLNAKASVDNRGIAIVDSQRILIGTSINIRCGDYASQGVITNFHIG